MENNQQLKCPKIAKIQNIGEQSEASPDLLSQSWAGQSASLSTSLPPTEQYLSSTTTATVPTDHKPLGAPPVPPPFINMPTSREFVGEGFIQFK